MRTRANISGKLQNYASSALTILDTTAAFIHKMLRIPNSVCRQKEIYDIEESQENNNEPWNYSQQLMKAPDGGR